MTISTYETFHRQTSRELIYNELEGRHEVIYK